jgi:hypothetical protein
MIWIILLYVELFLFVLMVLCSPLDLLLHFWAVMNCARVRNDDHLTTQAKIVALYLLVRGYWFDFLVNMTWMTVYLREWPHQLTVTARLNHHRETTGWRHDRCERIQEIYLKWFDTKHTDGIHR